MAEPMSEQINVPVSKDLKSRLAAACVMKPDGVSRYKVTEVVRIMLERGFDANHHLRLEDADAGEEAGA